MADQKLTALSADTSPTSDDLVLTVTDPAGTPANRKVTLANAVTKAHGLSDGIVKVASSTMAPATAGTDYYAPGGTDVAVADGGTGASSASGARTNLGSTSVGDAVFTAANAAAARTAIGAVIGTDVQAYDADLDTWATKTPPSGTVMGTTDTQTQSNKRNVPRITTITSNATPTINTDNCDAVTITALATAITSMTTNLSGTPNNFDKLTIRIKDDGTARGITWGASFEAKGVALPTTTVISKVLTVGFIYDTVTSKWGCVASAQEA